jgi:hypothetical protein
METYIKCCGLQAKIISRRLVLLLIGSVCFVSCLHDNEAETVKLDSMKTIDKSMLLHEITNKTLRDYIARFDSINNEGERGIRIDCNIFNDTTSYSIVYHETSSLPSAPMIKCEPINGRDITMVFENFENDVALTADRALELSRSALSEEDYQECKEVIDANKVFVQQPHIMPVSDKISLVLYFDSNQNLIRVDTLGFAPWMLKKQNN